MIHLISLTILIGHSLKEKQYPSYININSNHPSSIIKQVLKAVNMRIRRLSSNKNFHESKNIFFSVILVCKKKKKKKKTLGNYWVS